MYKWTNNRSTSVQSGPLSSSLINCESACPFFLTIFINCQTILRDTQDLLACRETRHTRRKISSPSCKMQPRNASWRLPLPLLLEISLLLLLTIGQSGATANSEQNAELSNKRLSGALYSSRLFIPLYKYANVRQTLLQKYMKSWIMMLNEPVPMQRAAVGSRVELHCVATGSPPPQIYWFSGIEAEAQIHDMITRLEEDINLVPVKREGFGQLNSTYVIDCVRPEDEGYKYCISVSKDKVVYSPSLLLVDETRTEECHSKISITLHAPWTLTSQGNTVFLPCKVEGEPQPYVTWLDNAGNIVPKSSFARRTVMPNGDLRIKNLEWSDMGQYTCRAHLDNLDVIHKSVTSFLYPVKNQTTPKRE